MRHEMKTVRPELVVLKWDHQHRRVTYSLDRLVFKPKFLACLLTVFLSANVHVQLDTSAELVAGSNVLHVSHPFQESKSVFLLRSVELLFMEYFAEN